MIKGPIEEREIRGLTGRALIWLVTSTITIVSSVTGSYILLNNKIEKVNEKIDVNIDKIRTEKIGDDKVIDLRIRVLEAEVKILEDNVHRIEDRPN
jgi:hypothetical protein